jgi:hypothetical protein
MQTGDYGAKNIRKTTGLEITTKNVLLILIKSSCYEKNRMGKICLILKETCRKYMEPDKDKSANNTKNDTSPQNKTIKSA